MKLVATTISRQLEQWQLSEIPYYCETVPMNATVLEKYPEASHVLMCDSYYVHQTEGLKQLIADYEKTDKTIILGGAVWGRIRARATDLYKNNYVRWFDEWALPEF